MNLITRYETKTQGFQYEFTTKDLLWFLFGKKISPKCGGKLIKRKDVVIAKGSDLNSKSDPFFASQINVKCYGYSYRCKQCEAQYTLSDISPREKE